VVEMFGSKVCDNSNKEFHLDSECKRLAEIPKKFRYRFWRFATIFACGYSPCHVCTKNRFTQEIDAMHIRNFYLDYHGYSWRGMRIMDDEYRFGDAKNWITISCDNIIFDTLKGICYVLN